MSSSQLSEDAEASLDLKSRQDVLAGSMKPLRKAEIVVLEHTIGAEPLLNLEDIKSAGPKEFWETPRAEVEQVRIVHHCSTPQALADMSEIGHLDQHQSRGYKVISNL